MFNLDVMEYFVRISDNFEEDKQAELHDLFDAIKFKLDRNNYHMSNIKRIIEQAKDLEKNDYYSDIYLPIYFEIEGFLVSLRSSVDMMIHLVNFSFEMDIKGSDVTLYNVYHNKKLPKPVKNTFDRYTRPYNNPTWNFIYTFRNEIVHEKSIHQVLPIKVDLFTGEEPLAFFLLEGIEKEILTFFNNCLRFLETFSSQLFQSIEVSL